MRSKRWHTRMRFAPDYGVPSSTVVDLAHPTVRLRDPKCLIAERSATLYTGGMAKGLLFRVGVVLFALGMLGILVSSDARVVSLLKNTVLLTIATCALSLPLGTFLALVLVRAEVPCRRLAIILLAGMLFVPSVDGASHSPREFTPWADCVNGANVLLQAALRMATS